MQRIWLLLLAGCVDSSAVISGTEDRASSEHALAETRAPSPAGLQHLGFFAGAGDTGELAALSNVAWTWINPGFDATQSAAEMVAALQAAEAQGMGVVLDVNGIFFRPDFTLKPEGEVWANWAVVEQAIRPHAASIVAFYPMDEPGNVCAGKTAAQCKPLRVKVKADLETCAFILKQSFPTVPVALIHTFWEMQSDLNGGEKLINPWNFDWLGFDCYGPFDDCMGRSIPVYQARLRQRLRPGQRTMLVPDAWSHGDSEAALVTRAGQYLQLAKSDPTVVALVPFLWRHFEMVGAAELPVVAQKWRDIGREVVPPRIAGAGTGCDDGRCVWITGTDFMSDSHVDLRLPGVPAIAATVTEVNRTLDTRPQVLTLRVPAELWNALDATGLDVWVVNPRRGNWSPTPVRVKR